MFATVSVTHDINKDIYKVSGYMGVKFKSTLHREIGEKKTNGLFIDTGMSSFSFYGFYTLEVYRVLELIISKASTFGTNATAIKSFLLYVETKIWQVDNPPKLLNRNTIAEKMKFKVMSHQEIALTTYENYKNRLGYRGLLFNIATGGGKTFTSLAIAEALGSNKIIVIAPSQTIDKVWVHSVTKELYINPQEYYVVNSNTPYADQRIIIANFEAIGKVFNILDRIKGRTSTVIVDESHNFAEATSKRTKELINLVNELNTDNVLLMSGTPIKAYSKELSVVFRLLDRRFSAHIEKSFMAIYGNPSNLFKKILPERFGQYSVTVKKDELKLEPVVTKYVPVKLKNGSVYQLANIKNDLREYIKIRSKELNANFSTYEDTYNRLYQNAKSIQLGNGLKERIFTDYETDFKEIIKAYKRGSLSTIPDTMKRANKFEKEVISVMLTSDDKRAFNEAKTILKYMGLKLQGEALANVIMRARISCHKDMAMAIDYKNIINSTTKKTIVFSNYIEVCNAAFSKLNYIGYKPVGVYGDTSKSLSSQVGIFNADKNINPMVATYKSLSTGVPLIVANVVIALDLPFRMYTYEQAIARAWRLGQDKTVYVYIPELDTGEHPNINTRNIDIISFYRDEVESITGIKLSLDIIAAATGDDQVSVVSNESYDDIIYRDNVRVADTPNHYNILNSW